MNSPKPTELSEVSSTGSKKSSSTILSFDKRPPSRTNSHHSASSSKWDHSELSLDSKGSNHYGADQRLLSSDHNDILSDFSSDTTFYDDDHDDPAGLHSSLFTRLQQWNYRCYNRDGNVHIFGEWYSRTKSQKCIVIGPGKRFHVYLSHFTNLLLLN